jgi:hypothetical protein
LVHPRPLSILGDGPWVGTIGARQQLFGPCQVDDSSTQCVGTSFPPAS